MYYDSDGPGLPVAVEHCVIFMGYYERQYDNLVSLIEVTLRTTL